MKGSSEDRKKGQLISEILGKIFPLKFCIRLSGSCDIYERFGEGINIVQTVNILPHIKSNKKSDVINECSLKLKVS